jgi:hypothetical protein
MRSVNLVKVAIEAGRFLRERLQRRILAGTGLLLKVRNIPADGPEAYRPRMRGQTPYPNWLASAATLAASGLVGSVRFFCFAIAWSSSFAWV